MYRRIIHDLTIGLLAGCLAASALAQGPGFGGGRRGGGFGRGQRGPGGPGGPGGFGRGGMMGGPMGMFGMNSSNDHDPRVSHIYQLLQRSDVQNEINLDLRQRNALTQYQSQVPGLVMQQVQQRMQQQMQSIRDSAAQSDPNNPQDRATRRQQMQEQIRQSAQQQRSEIRNRIDQGLTDILRPDQMSRLHELDLQWRGAMAVVDPKVADEVQVAAERRNGVNEIVNGYQQALNEERQKQMQAMMTQRQAVADGTATGKSVLKDPEVAIDRAEAAARKDGEEKTLRLLIPEEKARWTKALGRNFEFRSDLKTQRQ